MSEAIHQMFIGMGSIILAPFGGLPRPGYRITLPPENARQAIGYDFSRVANDLNRSIDKIQNEKQLELGLKK
jgi:hypothetical protein